MDLMTATTTATSTIFSATDALLDKWNFDTQVIILFGAALLGFLILNIVLNFFTRHG